MKLRIRTNTIRLRLKRSEVDRIAAGQSLVERTHFPGAALTYRLNASDGAAASAHFDQDGLVINLPSSEIQHWASTDQISIVAEQPVEDSETLSILVEKDFQCLSPGHHRPGEDDADTYPHPDADSGLGC